jgi:hypothetical protein
MHPFRWVHSPYPSCVELGLSDFVGVNGGFQAASIKVAARVDDDRLAGPGLGAAHHDHHLGEPSLSVGFFSRDGVAGRSP